MCSKESQGSKTRCNNKLWILSTSHLCLIYIFYILWGQGTILSMISWYYFTFFPRSYNIIVHLETLKRSLYRNIDAPGMRMYFTAECTCLQNVYAYWMYIALDGYGCRKHMATERTYLQDVQGSRVDMAPRYTWLHYVHGCKIYMAAGCKCLFLEFELISWVFSLCSM